MLGSGHATPRHPSATPGSSFWANPLPSCPSAPILIRALLSDSHQWTLNPGTPPLTSFIYNRVSLSTCDLDHPSNFSNRLCAQQWPKPPASPNSLFAPRVSSPSTVPSSSRIHPENFTQNYALIVGHAGLYTPLFLYKSSFPQSLRLGLSLSAHTSQIISGHLLVSCKHIFSSGTDRGTHTHTLTHSCLCIEIHACPESMDGREIGNTGGKKCTLVKGGRRSMTEIQP